MACVPDDGQSAMDTGARAGWDSGCWANDAWSTNPSWNGSKWGESSTGVNSDTRAPDHDHVLQMEIPYFVRGRILGFGGSRIQELESRSGARIIIEDNGGGDSMLKLCGAPEAVEAARLLVDEILDGPKGKCKGKGKGRSSAEVSDPVDLTEVMALPQNTADHVAGRLQEVIAKSGASISVQQCGDSGYLCLSGTQEAVAGAKAEISEMLDAIVSTANNGGTTDTVRNPNGRPLADLRVGDEIRGQVTGIVPKTGIWFDVGAATLGMLRWTDLRHCDYQLGEVVDGLRVKEIDCRAEQLYLQPPEGSAADIESAWLGIPRGYADLIIGKSGQLLAEISMQSGAHISVDQSSSQHFVQITGSPKALELAKVRVSAVLDGAIAAFGKGSKGRVEPSGIMAIPQNAVPVLIGRRGNTIAAIGAQSGTRLSVHQLDGEDVVFFFGAPESVATAKVLVKELLASLNDEEPARKGARGFKGKSRGKRSQSPTRRGAGEPTEARKVRYRGMEEPTEMLELPPGATPLILGTGGLRILEIQTSSGAWVHIDDSREPHVACFTGSPEAIEKAKLQVLDVIDGSVPWESHGKTYRIWKGKGKSRGMVSPSAPCGAMPPDDSIPIPKGMTSRLVGRGGQRIKDVMWDSGAYILTNQRSCPHVVQLYGMPEEVDYARAVIEEMLDDMAEADASFDPDPLMIPADLVPRVIGTRGVRIKSIQERSGARINIVEGEGSDPARALFRGSADAVRSAKAAVVDILEGGLDEPCKGGGKKGKAICRSSPRCGLDVALDPAQDTVPETVAHAALDAALPTAPLDRSKPHGPPETVELPWCMAAEQSGGSCSATVRETEEQSGAKVVVDQSSGRCLARLSGSKDSVASAKVLLLEAIVEVAKCGQVTRGELFRMVFRECDTDGDGRLAPAEKRRFGNLAGWQSNVCEYDSVCRDLSVDPSSGIDVDALASLIDGQSPWHCSDEQLVSMLSSLVSAAKLKARTAQKQGLDGSKVALRSEMIHAVFVAFDRNADGRLSSEELRDFARRTRWLQGPEDAWEEQYRATCLRCGADRALGLDKAAFQKLVDDEEQGGIFANGQLCAILRDLDATTANDITDQGNHVADGVAKCTKPSEHHIANGVAPHNGSHVVDEVKQRTEPSGCGITNGVARRSEPSRAEMIKAIFELCDADGDGQLIMEELRNFAERALWFAGEDDEWTQEYESICSDANVGVDTGVDLQVLSKLVNDKAGAYCTDEQLRGILAQLRERGQPEPAELRRESRPAIPSEDASRAALIAKAFSACDSDGSGRLRCQELRRFSESARLFAGSEEEWMQEYRVLCADVGVDASAGFDLERFGRFVNDEAGGYCPDVLLDSVVAELRAKPSEPTGSLETPLEQRLPFEETPAVTPSQPPQSGHSRSGRLTSSRDEIIEALFGMFDEDGDGVLNEREMLRFARWTGFNSTDEVWSRAYTELFLEAESAASGVDLTHFTRLVNDTSEEGCHCTLEELQDMLDTCNSREAERTGSSVSNGFVSTKGSEGAERRPEPAGSKGPKGPEERREPAGSRGSKEAEGVPEPCGCRGTKGAKERLDPAGAKGSKGAEERLDPARGKGPKGAAERLEPPGNGGSKGTKDGLNPTGSRERADVSSPWPSFSTNWQHGSGPQGVRGFRAAEERLEQEKLEPADSRGSWAMEGWQKSAGSSSPKGAEEGPRASLVNQLFAALDANTDGRLEQQELRRFFELKGCYHSNSGWREVFRLLTRGEPLDRALFARLLDNDEDAHCSDCELRSLLAEVQSEAGVQPEPLEPDPAALSRMELISAVLRTLDADGDGRLNQQELRQLLERRGCCKSDQDLAEAYGTRPVDHARLQELLSSEDCPNEDLRGLLTDLRRHGS